MTGGPNAEKHDIDYEFSEYDRNDLIYRFAKKVSGEDLANATTKSQGAEG
jgi:hypothetical protein